MTVELTLSELLNGREIRAHAELGSSKLPSFFGRSKSGRIQPTGLDPRTRERVPCELAHCPAREVLGDWAYRPGPRQPWVTVATKGAAIRALNRDNPKGHSRGPRRGRGRYGLKA